MLKEGLSTDTIFNLPSFSSDYTFKDFVYHYINEDNIKLYLESDKAGRRHRSQ
jgi:hypothetical protein